ncbi:MAG: hypothetical protein IKX71_03745 [Bacteroidales bacterium]|nr:hypothetical protein [Bacteroidales bacterium]
MKKVLYIALVAVLALILAGCCKNGQDKEKRMVLIYIAATEQSVSNYASGNITDMLTGYVPKRKSETEALLVFLQKHGTDTPRSEATLTRYFSNNSGNIDSEIIANFGSDFDACDPDSFARVLATAEAECKPTHRSLLFSSHGTGWMPEGYFDSDGEHYSKSQYSLKNTGSSRLDDLSKLRIRDGIGLDRPTGHELDIRDFASVTGQYHWDVMLLDCCYLGAVEAAYELRNCCDYIAASPTEIMINGFPYNCILENLFKYPNAKGYKTICQRYYDMYQAMTGSYQSGTISLVDCSQMDAFASVCASITALQRTQMESVDRMSVQHYFWKSDKDYFFDLADYFSRFATEEQMESFSAQLDKTVIFKAATAEFIGLKINPDTFSGLSCYIPDPRYVNLNAYYKQLAWNQKVNIVQ